VGKLLNIYNKNIYKVKKDQDEFLIIIIYNISANHYVGLNVYADNDNNKRIYIESINKYIDIDSLSEYNKKNIKSNVYKKGKPLSINDKDYENICKEIKTDLLNKLNKKTNDKIVEDMSYLKWCYDKLLINEKETDEDSYKQNSIHWIEFGSNVGSELRKLRPGILWRPSGDKKMWTIIPLSTKCRNDEYYFHYDVECAGKGTAKIESLVNFSYKRIREPFFDNHKILYITNKDSDEIKRILKEYYAFEFTK